MDGAQIHYQTFAEKFNEKEKPALLFVHGHAAHSHWWDFIAPAFCDRYHVAAMDMSGSGDSDHRQQYSAFGFAREVLSVADQIGNSCIVVGHSFGGSITRIAAYLHCTGELTTRALDGVVLADSVISTSKGSRKSIPIPIPRQKRHFFTSLEHGMKRFRLRPPQPCENRYLLDYIAEHSLKETEQGFEFKLDQLVFSKMVPDHVMDLPDAAPMIGEITNIDRGEDQACQVGFIYGAQSRFFSEKSQPFLEELFSEQRVIQIPDAHHHLFLDQPLAFLTVLSQMLERMTP